MLAEGEEETEEKDDRREVFRRGGNECRDKMRKCFIRDKKNESKREERDVRKE